jgi:rubrerythrin
MKAHTPEASQKPQHFTRTLFIVVLSALALSLLVPLSGCKKNEPKQSQPEITLQNLQSAYVRELRIEREYALFSKRAERDRYGAIANLFRAASRSEQIHAEMAAGLLRGKGVEVKPFTPDSITVGSVMQTLRLAVSDEGLETESMYPNLARTAELEKFPEAAESFRRSLAADKRHVELFKDALDKGGTIARIQYYVCPTCGYVITSATADECPSCHTKKEKFEKI